MARFTAAPAATLAKARQAREYLKQHLLDKGVLVFMDYNTRKQAMRIKLYGYAVPERMEKLKPLGFVISQASGFGATVYINEEGVILPNPLRILERVKRLDSVRPKVASIRNIPYCPHCGHVL